MGTNSMNGNMRRAKRRGLSRWTALATVVTTMLCVASVVNAQVYYAYPGAPPVQENAPALGVTLGFGDDLFRAVGFGRFNINNYADLGLELVLDSDDDNFRGGAAVDVKYAIVPRNTTMPFDLSLNSGFGLETGEDITNVNIPIGAMVSDEFELSSNNTLVPYGGVYFMIQYLNWDIDDGPGDRDFDEDDWDTDVELRLGTALHFTPGMAAFATLHLGAGDRFYIGLNFLL